MQAPTLRPITRIGSLRASRSCVVCRQRRPATRLLALACAHRGRAAYVCIDMACLTELSARDVCRALRTGSPDGVTLPTLAELNVLAARNLRETLLLARRAGDAMTDDASGLDGNIRAGRLADRAAYWRNLWYETHGHGETGANLRRGA